MSEALFQGPAFGVSVQAADFDAGEVLRALSAGQHEVGAVASFTGLVRGSEPQAGHAGQALLALEIEHYPAMTQKSLEAIVTSAAGRWPLQATRVIHRTGRLAVGEQIVLVACASAHREAALQACEYIMDYLKNDAPFWKKAIYSDSEAWIDAKASDRKALERW